MNARRRTLIAAVAVAAATHGCTRVPPPAVPVAPAELSAVLDGLALCEADAEGLRGSGRGEISVSGRRLPFAYAFVYSRPGWLRADIRPDVAMMPGRLTTLFLLDDASAHAFLPERMLEITGQADDFAARLPWRDHAAVAVGASDARFLAHLDNPALARDGDSLILTGTSGDQTVTAEFGESPSRLLSLEVRGPRETLSVSYSGHGWRTLSWLPQIVKMKLSTPGRRTSTVTLRHEAARGLGEVKREDYVFDVPAGATTVDWRDLDL